MRLFLTLYLTFLFGQGYYEVVSNFKRMFL